MGHDPERDVIAYLAGGLGSERRAAFSDHLMVCQLCWHELQAVQQGRQLAEAGRVVAPAQLRERIRGLVLAEEQSEQAQRAPARTRPRLPDRWRGAGLPLGWPQPVRVLWWLLVAGAAASHRLLLDTRVSVRRRLLAALAATPFALFSLGIAFSASWSTWH